ncbi:MAG TPA: 3-dehydroquinate synthase [Woeseiaceae bacterium]|nr:3-dehydroquinate synthase [Woeseiaceae bacterium]
MQPPTTISVELGERSYPILIGRGLIGELDLTPWLTGPDCLVVTNETVAPLWLERLRGSLGGARREAVSLPDGERHKTLEALQTVIDALASMRAGRDAAVVALGGGVVGDIAGFAAACYMRGIAFIQVPTTLLAQVDSSVGGKTGVNHRDGKNLIGAFHQPRAVLIDTDVLGTLPERELKAGLAEVIKHAVISDHDFFVWLEANIDDLREREPAALAHAIRRSCEIKAAVVAADEREAGQRTLLNYGHTFAHAIENTLGYGEWLHGEAVAAGMIMAAELSDLEPGERDRLRRLLERAGLPTAAPAQCTGSLLAAMKLDKKNRAGQIRFVLLKRLGEAFTGGTYSAARLQEILRS